VTRCSGTRSSSIRSVRSTARDSGGNREASPNQKPCPAEHERREASEGGCPHASSQEGVGSLTYTVRYVAGPYSGTRTVSAEDEEQAVSVVRARVRREMTLPMYSESYRVVSGEDEEDS
jgi:hypothetical protein